MDYDEAVRESERRHPGSRSLRCIRYCGVINGKIREAARLGEKQVKLDFPPKHYVARHRELFIRLYEGQGYHVSFDPDFRYIQPTRWTLTISWNQPSQITGLPGLSRDSEIQGRMIT